jgi:hypothetical protein
MQAVVADSREIADSLMIVESVHHSSRLHNSNKSSYLVLVQMIQRVLPTSNFGQLVTGFLTLRGIYIVS